MVQTVFQHPEGYRTIIRVKLGGFSNVILFFISSKGASAIRIRGGAPVLLAQWSVQAFKATDYMETVKCHLV